MGWNTRHGDYTAPPTAQPNITTANMRRPSYMTLGPRAKGPDAKPKNELPPFPARQMLVLGKSAAAGPPKAGRH